MKAIRWIDKYLEEVFIAFFLIAIVTIMFYMIVMRYVFANAPAWAEELSRYCFVWFTFLGMSYSIKYDLHLKVDIFSSLPPFKAVFSVLSDIVFFAYIVFMLEPGVNMVMTLRRFGQLSTALELPIYIVYLSLLTGYVLSIFRLLQKYILKLSALLKRTKSGTIGGEV